MRGTPNLRQTWARTAGVGRLCVMIRQGNSGLLSIAANDLAVDSIVSEMVSVLSVHNIKEEQILYPGIDDILGAKELSAAFARMESIPETAAA